jgi:carbon-monoxide dehydrogenase medium subunit
MKIWNEYIIAESLQQADNSFADLNENVKFIAGGTDLLLEIQQGRHNPVERLVDVNQIPELGQLVLDSETIFIGAAVAVSTIACSSFVYRHAQALCEATGLIGGPQVRNVATLGGNVAHALPAADGMIALVALDATARIYSCGTIQDRPILSLFIGPGKTAIKRNELIAGFLIKKRLPGESSAFQRIMRPQGVALPILNCAIWMKRDQNKIDDIRIVFGPSGPVPSRAEGVESELRGKEFSQIPIERAIDAIQMTVKFRSSPRRASAEYRYELAKDLFSRVLHSAWERTLA